MKNMERQDFEDSWKRAFDKAEIPPSENVWTNIELDLERAKGSRLKKRLAIFQLATAASIIFALGLGAGIFIMKISYENPTEQLALNQIKTESAKGAAATEKNSTASESKQEISGKETVSST